MAKVIDVDFGKTQNRIHWLNKELARVEAMLAKEKAEQEKAEEREIELAKLVDQSKRIVEHKEIGVDFGLHAFKRISELKAARDSILERGGRIIDLTSEAIHIANELIMLEEAI